MPSGAGAAAKAAEHVLEASCSINAALPGSSMGTTMVGVVHHLKSLDGKNKFPTGGSRLKRARSSRPS
jgi:hypothetical protein